MNSPRLKLISSHGDQTLSAVRFVVPVTTKPIEDLDSGLHFTEGEVVASTDLVGVLEAKPNIEQLIIMAVPPEFYLGYAVFTTAYIDRDMRRVVGAPMKYAAGRQQLALYMDREVEAARERIEAEVAEGYALNQRPGFVVAPNNILGHFRITPGFHSAVRQAKVLSDSFQPLDLAPMEQTLTELFHPDEPASSVLVSSVVADLLVSTVESLVMSRLRMMRWQGLGALGYKFYDGETEIATPMPPGGLEAHRQQVTELHKTVESSTFFAGRLAWLRSYAMTEAQIMHVELDEGAGMH